MEQFVQGVRRNLPTILALTLAYTAIMLNLGIGWVLALSFLNGCAYIIFLALRP
jgi:hypothetical protein